MLLSQVLSWEKRQPRRDRNHIIPHRKNVQMEKKEHKHDAYKWYDLPERSHQTRFVLRDAYVTR